MGSNRNLILLVLALVVLAGLYLVSSGRREHVDETGGFRDVVEGQLSTDEVYGISVSHGTDAGEGFTLAKQGEEWVVTSYHDAPANLNKIRTLLGNLESLEGEFRSDDPAVLEDYSLDEEGAYHLSVRDESGDAMVELLIGERSGSGVFVRQTGSDTVLLGDHNFLSDFGIWGDERKAPDVKSWVDLVAFSVDKEAVRRIELRGDEMLVMEKEFEQPTVAEDDTTGAAPPAPETYEWRVVEPDDFLATKTRADAVLNSLASIRARDVVGRLSEAEAETEATAEGEAEQTGETSEAEAGEPAARPDYGLGDAADRIVVSTEDGSTHTLLFGNDVPDADNQFYFRVEGEDLVWTMPGYLRDNLFKSAEDLRPE